MYLINWLNLRPTDDDLQKSIQGLSGVVYIRTLLQALVRLVLAEYPWEDRSDLALVFDPSNSYEPGDVVAIPRIDEQSLRPDTWRLGAVRTVEVVENPIQGAFQVVKVGVDERTQIYAAEIPDAEPFPIAFPVENAEDLDWLVSDIVDTYQSQLTAAMSEAIEEGRLQGVISDDKILLGDLSDLCGEQEGDYLAEIFHKSSPEVVYLTTDRVLAELRALGCLTHVPDEIACFSLEALLSDYGFRDLGDGRWITPERLAELDRFLNRRMSVPVMRSKVAQEMGEDDKADFEAYEEIDLEPEAQVALEEMGEEESELTAELSPEIWQPPSTPIPLRTLTYLHIVEGFFPLGKRLARAFNPQQDPSLVEIQIIEGEHLSFLASREEGVVKALDAEAFRYRFLDAGIPAGTKLWLEYQDSYTYRIAPRPLPEPVSVKCKLASIEDGRLVIDEAEIEVAFETDANVFKAELRFEDLEALFVEAEQSGSSIFDAIWYTFEELSRKNPDVRLHYTEVFNAVFFRHRMCSPRSVVTELYNRPCFVPVGDGYFKFEPERGIKRYQVPKKETAIQRSRSTTTPKPERIAEEYGFFIFQQRQDSEYSDRIGTIYNWRKGIPGSNQIKRDVRFIYYRPGDKVFFGTGRIERIESYQGEDGNTYYDGHVRDYRKWKPPLSLDHDLARQLSFYQPGRVWVGQAGIRQISEKDFKIIAQAYERSLPDASARGESHPPREPQLDDPLWYQVSQLVDHDLRTLAGGAPLRVTKVDEHAVRIRLTSSGNTYDIYRKELQRVFDVLSARGELSQVAIREELGEPNPTYVSTILAALPGITHATKPITLYYGTKSSSEAPSFWEQIRKLEGRRLHKVIKYTSFAFTVKKVTEDRVQIIGDSGRNQSPAWRKDLEQAWELLLSKRGVSYIEIAQISPKNYPNLVALLAALPSIEYDKESQKLIYRPVDKSSVVAAPSKLERTRTGQLVATDLIPPGPLFEKQPDQRAPEPTADAEKEEIVSREPEKAEALYEEERPAGVEVKIPDKEEVPTPGQGIPPETPAPSPPLLDRSAPQRQPTSTTKSLFSQHYIENRIQEHPEWGEDIWEAFDESRTLYQSLRDHLLGMNEAQMEAEFIRPVLEMLGFAFIPQAATSIGGRPQRPDYTLFSKEDVKSEAYNLQDNEDAFYARALAIADAKHWERPLSERGMDNRNPSFQIVNYLIGTGVDWGILTNGRQWRLYYRRASSTATEFYEVDLAELLEGGDVEAFKYFWLFFRRQAFEKDAQGRNFLERVREQSTIYARQVGDRLKDLVFGQVFPGLAGGFVAYSIQQGVDVSDEPARMEVYQATLSFLYKLLFLLYAEARSLLPMENAGYRNRSLTRMAGEIALRLDRQEPLGYTSTDFYDSLLNLFRIIDRGDRGLGLPRYNGGLFHFDFKDPADQEHYTANSYLDQHKIPDAFLAPALDRLVRIEGQSVDYSYLQVRHLGAIYEGLLEHRLRVDHAAQGRVHLETDKGERKATGSYYTPDYIVEYIVSNTLGPILEERGHRFDDLMRQIRDLRKRLAREHRSDVNRTLQAELEKLERQARETLLDIKLCDPAMGSGHFLVEAVDFLTDRLIEILNQHPEDNPVISMLEHIRANILDSMERQGISIDQTRLDDTQILQRVIMKRCIYGVDLNPMAVELAKVSLWLHSFTVGAPLSFLDHHLRWGNSLIGAMAREADKELSQLGGGAQMTFLSGPFAGLLRAAEIMRGISGLSDATFAEVEESERLYEEFDRAAKPYKRLLDMYVARHFGVKRADEFLRLYGVDAMQAEPESVGEPYRTALLEARRIYEEKHFFHWDLEFPEVFIDLERATWKENPGFDAVVGNPPYGFVSDKAEQKVLSSTLYAISSYDSYVAFLERGIQTLSRSGFISYITPTSWQTGLGYRDFRDYVLRTCRVNQIVNLPYDIFPDAYIDTGIYVFRKECTFQKSNPFLNRGTNFFNFGKRDNAETKLSSDLAFSEVEMKQWVGDDQLRFVTDLGLLRLRQRFSTVPTISLGEFTISARGILPSGSDIAPERLGDEYRPFFDGDLFRYELILGTSKWVEYGTNLRELPSSYEFFQGKRVLIRRLISRQARIMAVYTETEFVTKKDIYSILISSGEVSLLAILSLLNSRLFSYWYLAQSMVATRDDFPQVTLADLRTLPIRQITFATSPETRRRAVEEAQRLYQDCKEAQFFDSDSCVHRLLDFVDRQLSQEPEQSDVVHDLLAYLAEKMIMMNRQKRAEVQGFLTWLELEVGAPLDELTNKTKIRGYLGDYQKSEDHLASEDLLDILHQNRRRLDVDPSARHFQNRLMQEYQASLEKLLPLKQRLTATDRLIDLVVYRLYGLTDEELAIVEGGNSAPPNPT